MVLLFSQMFLSFLAYNSSALSFSLPLSLFSIFYFFLSWFFSVTSEDGRSFDLGLSSESEERGFYTEIFHSTSWVFRGDDASPNNSPRCLSKRPRPVAGKYLPILKWVNGRDNMNLNLGLHIFLAATVHSKWCSWELGMSENMRAVSGNSRSYLKIPCLCSHKVFLPSFFRCPWPSAASTLLSSHSQSWSSLILKPFGGHTEGLLWETGKPSFMNFLALTVL